MEWYNFGPTLDDVRFLRVLGMSFQWFDTSFLSHTRSGDFHFKLVIVKMNWESSQDQNK